MKRGSVAQVASDFLLLLRDECSYTDISRRSKIDLSADLAIHPPHRSEPHRAGREGADRIYQHAPQHELVLGSPAQCAGWT